MDRETLRRLEMLNQLSLTEIQKDEVIGFFDKREADSKSLDTINTEETERMVHVMPIMTVVREDVVNKQYTAEQLQKGAPETDEGYWCVPKVVE
ncbi:MAG: Asp-tRNA(Asn)/Glu-tRNA(Gln) amidotransferase subunit GatC [Clostridia bacterium]|nr:Asp-tRNA(Asn)/Glu-tRNA(Gln) amidotransferase subunit GatC [Clostridia bacterium]MBO7289522.1 Asp-tRNA(Asn)/Glu-tRNA(Gln) amidotransferase subunit GatC [Clostridia bacterium]